MRISYSSLSLFKSCPKAYEFYKIINAEKTDQCEFFAYSGTVGQWIFEHIINDRLYRTQSLESIIDDIENSIEETIKLTTYQVDTKKPKKGGHGVGFFETFEAMFMIDYAELHIEDLMEEMEKYVICTDTFFKKFSSKGLDKITCEEHLEKTFVTSKNNEYTLHGYCDFYIRNNDKEISILDGKRNTFVSYNNFNEPEFPHISPTQLLIYGLLSDEELRGISFYDYTLNKIVKVPLSDNYREETKHEIDTVIDKIVNTKIFEALANKSNCKFCSYKNLCDGYKNLEAGKLEL